MPMPRQVMVPKMEVDPFDTRSYEALNYETLTYQPQKPVSALQTTPSSHFEWLSQDHDTTVGSSKSTLQRRRVAAEPPPRDDSAWFSHLFTQFKTVTNSVGPFTTEPSTDTRRSSAGTRTSSRVLGVRGLYHSMPKNNNF